MLVQGNWSALYFVTSSNIGFTTGAILVTQNELNESSQLGLTDIFLMLLERAGQKVC